MAERKIAIFIIAGTTLLVLVCVTGVFDPHRWSMYRTRWSYVVPVSFFGQVVGPDGQPLRDVEVDAAVVTANWAFILGASRPSRSKPHVLRTDANGRFSIERERGYSVRVEALRKEGFSFTHAINEGVYYFAGPGAHPRPHQSNANNPVIFRMQPEKTAQIKLAPQPPSAPWEGGESGK